MKGKLELKGMEFKAYHGCLESERINGGLYLVDFCCETDCSRAALSDSLEDTLDYSLIYGLVKKEMEQPSNLIENVCARIFSSIGQAFPELEHFSVKVTKLQPPVGGSCKSAEFELSR